MLHMCAWFSSGAGATRNKIPNKKSIQHSLQPHQPPANGLIKMISFPFIFPVTGVASPTCSARSLPT